MFLFFFFLNSDCEVLKRFNVFYLIRTAINIKKKTNKQTNKYLQSVFIAKN